MGSAFFVSVCGRFRQPWPCPRASSARWTDHHGAGSARLCRGLSSCTASRPWSWPRKSGPAIHPGRAGTRAAGTGNPGRAIRPPPSRARQSDLATASAVGGVRLRQCRPWGSRWLPVTRKFPPIPRARARVPVSLFAVPTPISLPCYPTRYPTASPSAPADTPHPGR